MSDEKTNSPRSCCDARRGGPKCEHSLRFRDYRVSGYEETDTLKEIWWNSVRERDEALAQLKISKRQMAELQSVADFALEENKKLREDLERIREPYRRAIEAFKDIAGIPLLGTVLGFLAFVRELRKDVRP